MNSSQTKSGVIVYDGECTFCRRQVERIRRHDPAAQFDYRPRQDPKLSDEFPQLAQQHTKEGMRLVLPSGEVLIGADAVYQIHRRLPVYRRFTFLYRVPVLHGLFRLSYALIARNRRRISRFYCKDGSCAVPQK